jgi:hypothetical protein
MPNHPVLILVRNDIDRVRSEFPALDYELIERIYQQLVVALLRQPTEDELRAHVVKLTTRMDDPTLRGFLGLPPKARAGPRGGSRRTSMPASGDGARAVRRSGRPDWTAELFWARYQEACEQVGAPYAHVEVARRFRGLDGEHGIDPDHFRRLLRRFGLPPA